MSQQTKWLGQEMDENGTKPNEEKVEAIILLKPTEITKKLKPLLGTILYMAKFLPKLSERTDRLIKLPKKYCTMDMGRRIAKKLGKMKQMSTEGPCLTHYAKDKEKIVSADASTTGFGITLRQKQDDGNTKPRADI